MISVKAKTAIKKIIKQTNWTQARLAAAVGLKDQRVLANRLTQENISINIAQEMLNKMGYEIVFQPVSGGRRKEGSFVIDGIDPPGDGGKK